MTSKAVGKAAIIVLASAFLLVMTSLSLEGRYVLAEWDERIIMVLGFLGLTAAAMTAMRPFAPRSVF